MKVSLDSSKVVNVTPCYARLMVVALSGSKAEIISDRLFETMLVEMKQLKEYSNRILIALSIMEEYNYDTWEEIIEHIEETSVVSWNLYF